MARQRDSDLFIVKATYPPECATDVANVMRKYIAARHYHTETHTHLSAEVCGEDRAEEMRRDLVAIGSVIVD